MDLEPGRGRGGADEVDDDLVAGEGLASLTPEATSALITLATTAARWSTRRDAAAILGQADPAVEVEAALVALFTDDDDDVRKAAGSALTCSPAAVPLPRCGS